MAAVAALLAACSTGNDSITGPTIPPGGSVTITVASYPSLASAGGIQILSNYDVAVVNTGSGYMVFSLVCPHQGGQVTKGGRATFYCSRHGAEWNASGQWVGGQRTTNLHQVTSTYDSSTGVLTIG
jgi:Rieske Fe-S protein